MDGPLIAERHEPRDALLEEGNSDNTIASRRSDPPEGVCGLRDAAPVSELTRHFQGLLVQLPRSIGVAVRE